MGSIKLIIGVLVVIIAIAVSLISRNTTPTPVAEPVAEQMEQTATPAPALAPATGDIDDTVQELITATDVEAANANEEFGDTDLFDAETQAVGDFDQVYDEREF